jgi:hypothetical protein
VSWTAPRTWVAGELATAALFNTHLRDNLNILKTSINDDGTLHSCARLLDKSTTEQDVANTAVETSVYSYSVAGGTLSTLNILRLVMTGYIDLSASSATLTLRVKYGTVTISSGALCTTASTKGGVTVEAIVSANGATNAQRSVVNIQSVADNATQTDGTSSSSNTKWSTAYSTLTEDSTAAKTIQITAQWGSAVATAHFKRWAAWTEVLTA